MIGLIGAHRTGKTSLAKAYADKHGVTFVETSVSAIFRELGVDPAAPMDFGTRLTVQEQVLARVDALYGSYAAGEQLIADRTPIDMIGYLMADAVGHAVAPEHQARFDAYVQRCFDVANKRFSVMVLVQPGIALVEASGKAAMNRAYIEHLNSLMFGLTFDPRVKMPTYFIHRNVLDMAERVSNVEAAADKASVNVLRQVEAHRAAGGYLQ